MRIRPMTRDDVGIVADINMRAFADDELFNWLYPHKDQYLEDSRRWQRLVLRSRLVERGSRGSVCETEPSDDCWDETLGSVIVGYCFFVLKGSGDKAQKWQTQSLSKSKSRFTDS